MLFVQFQRLNELMRVMLNLGTLIHEAELMKEKWTPITYDNIERHVTQLQVNIVQIN